MRSVGVGANRRPWLAFGLGIVAIALVIDALHPNGPVGVDFHTYIAASQVGVEEGWSRIYDQTLVAVEQKELSPGQVAQPYLSPPTVALITAPLGVMPYASAYALWAVMLILALTAAFVWASVSRGWGRWIAIVAALAPWWVTHAVTVGQVVPLVAAGAVVTWRLTRERRDLVAGLALVTIVLKPNTAVLVPFALAFAMRWRLFTAWAAGALAVAIVVALTVGADGLSSYVTQLSGRLPRGSDNLTLHASLGVTGMFATALRLLIVGGVFAASYKLRESPGLVIALAIVGSLVIAPYLHATDLCLLAAAGWMVWEERPALSWRVPVALVWILASPYVHLTGYGPRMRQWALLEIAFLLALVIAACWPLTAWADSRRRAPA